MMAASPLANGFDPTMVSPGVGAFWVLLILAVVIILIARSFTVHMRRIQARAAEQAEADRHAEDGRASEDEAQQAGPTDDAPPAQPPRERGPS
ncbi:hypothetical protein LQF12_12560 [Ruania suaedae]|uniref:hypothetical protein n=1 Tax=Ruania suaedae TaxID=2897774 RepID=UPI001E4B7432|nr:hypothetical protein [Ruania suaedae]UFU02328.1 hypothetical protein LQF12_12560 [Ruania suaedae]